MDYIVSHTNTDFDALAATLAALKLYPEATAVFPGSQEKKVRRFIEDFGPFPIKRMREADPTQTTRLIVVDTKSARKLGPFAAALENKDIAVHLYDHHPHGPRDIHGAVEVVEDVGATATIFTELLVERGVAITPMEATILALGIYEETGSMLFRGTTERDLRAAAWLLKRGASLAIVSTYLKTGMTREELEILGSLTHEARHEVIRGVRVLLAKASLGTYQGDAAQLAHSLMEAESPDALFLMLAMEGKVLVVARSSMPELNVAEVLAEFGGGGHPFAASATMADTPLELIEERIVESIEAAVRPTQTARDIMTHPVVTVEAALTVKDAESAMTRYGVNALPVIRDGAYAGVVTREVVEKAIFHGFRASPVSRFMSTEVATALPATPVREMEKTMIEQNQRFLPVLDEGRIVGAITRTDILRVMYEDYLHRTGVEHHEAEARGDVVRNMSAWLRGRLPEKVYAVLNHVGEVGSALCMDVYTVGGFVRDLLMGRRSGPEAVDIDIDIVVEGDGIAFASALAARLGARMKSHERFGTAKLRMPGLALDVATARTEYYESPAALPTVESSSIKKDLYRRDFTINTLALKLTTPEFGKLVDFFGGRRDIKEKTVRVLHDLSLVEDPTRAFRAVRFAERFGFSISRHTERLIASALDMRLFAKLSGARLSDEISLIFTEAEPTRAVERLDSLGLLSVVHPSLKLDDGLRALMRALHETLLWHRLSFIDEPIDRGRVFLMGLLSGLPCDELRAALARLSVPETVEKRMLAEIALARETAMALPLPDPVRVWELLSRLTPEAILFAMASAGQEEAKRQISHYLLVQRSVRPLLTGHDLKEVGIPQGPIYSQLLDGILRERLRGALVSREDELAYVRASAGPQAPAPS